MDESKLQGPHKTTPAPAGRTDFIPMTLVMQPNGLKVELTRPEMLLGRHSGADLRLPMPDVSRRHCRFVFQDGVWRVIDQESLNGIFLNEERVDEAILQDQDCLGIGGLRFKVMITCLADTVRGSPASAGLPQRKAS